MKCSPVDKKSSKNLFRRNISEPFITKLRHPASSQILQLSAEQKKFLKFSKTIKFKSIQFLHNSLFFYKKKSFSLILTNSKTKKISMKT